jgi:hypothetical protein
MVTFSVYMGQYYTEIFEKLKEWFKLEFKKGGSNEKQNSINARILG